MRFSILFVAAGAILVGIRRGTGGGRSLALNGHVDTVAPVEPDRWLCGSPFAAEVRDGRLYGLGSTDMKGSAAAMWLAAKALADERVSLRGDLHLHSVVGEEMMEHGAEAEDIAPLVRWVPCEPLGTRVPGVRISGDWRRGSHLQHG